MRRRLCLALGFSLSLAACAPSESVIRVIDGRPVEGAFVPADAYAAYLRASIADAAGDLAGAVEGYAVAAALGPHDPEPLARLGDARCRRNARDPRAEESLARALAIDSSYGPALEARARCAERRGEDATAIESARRAARANPDAVEPLATLARLDAGSSNGSSAAAVELRERLVAMTLLEGTNAAAWDALATWARGHGDAELEGRALAHVVSLSTSRAKEIGTAIARLEGEGELVAARSLARARLEATGMGTGPVDPRIARLAIDDALLAGDPDAARRIATRGRVELAVVAARALLLGNEAVAREIATTLADADPVALAPRLVLAAVAEGTGERTHHQAEGAAVARALAGSWRRDVPAPPEAWLAYARAVVRAGAPEGARAVLGAIPREEIIPGDPLTTRVAVALGAAGGARREGARRERPRRASPSAGGVRRERRRRGQRRASPPPRARAPRAARRGHDRPRPVARVRARARSDHRRGVRAARPRRRDRRAIDGGRARAPRPLGPARRGRGVRLRRPERRRAHDPARARAPRRGGAYARGAGARRRVKAPAGGWCFSPIPSRCRRRGSSPYRSTAPRPSLASLGLDENHQPPK